MLSNRKPMDTEFLSLVRHYLSHHSTAQELDGDGKPGRNVLPGGLQENRFYRFDAEAMCAVRYAIEDLALEAANGAVLSSFPCARDFEVHRERYQHLAATVQKVDLVISGVLPRRLAHTRFIKDARGSCRSYAAIAYEARETQIVFVCQPINATAVPDDRLYDGLFSFSPRLVKRFRQEMLAMASGQLPVLREFHRLRALDRANKQVQAAFARERQVLEATLQHMLVDGRRCRTTHLAADLERGLDRLHRWRSRLVEMLAREENSQA